MRASLGHLYKLPVFSDGVNMRKNKRRDLQHTCLHRVTNENLAFIA